MTTRFGWVGLGCLALVACGPPPVVDVCKGRLAGDLVVTEIMLDPEGTDTGGEWFEIYNTLGTDIDLKGMVIFTRDTDEEFPNFYDIQLSARFAYVPVTNTPTTDWNGNSTLNIDSIAPVYLQRVYGGNCSPSGCGISFDPGFGYVSTDSSDNVSAFTAFLFPEGSLPGQLGSPTAPSELGQHRVPRLIR